VERSDDDEPLVRCLDCGTVYALPVAQEEATPCPNCGGVVWVALGGGAPDEPDGDS
jgi:uncharacterized Zn finger protein